MIKSVPKAIINLNAVAHNYNYIKSITNNDLAAVVKANAYGFGMKEIASHLHDVCKCSHFFVANINEAIDLRETIQNAKIYVFHGIFKNEERYFDEYNLIPVINDIYQLEIWQNYAIKNNKKLPVSLHFDTGMNRLGINYKDIVKIKNMISNHIDIDLILSHLSYAENKNSELNKIQLEKFCNISSHFPSIKKSFANSPGVDLGKEYFFDITRIGRALYGPNKYASLPNDLKNVISIYAPIIQIRELEEDSPIGYSATHIAKKGSKIATLSIGYADGYMRLFGNIASVYMEGFYLPVIGKISMDLITIDITHVPQEYVQIGKYVEIIGKNIEYHDILVQSGTSSSEMFSKLGSRIERNYITGHLW